MFYKRLKKGQTKFAKTKTAAAVYLEENWALNFDDVTEDSAITKGNILHYLIDNTVNEVAHKLAHRLPSGAKNILYGGILQIRDRYAKKYNELRYERVWQAMETFCAEPFVFNVPQSGVTPPTPEMMETEDSTNETPHATIGTENVASREANACISKCESKLFCKLICSSTGLGHGAFLAVGRQRVCVLWMIVAQGVG